MMSVKKAYESFIATCREKYPKISPDTLRIAAVNDSLYFRKSSEDKIEVLYNANLTPQDMQRKMADIFGLGEDVRSVEKGSKNSFLFVTLKLGTKILDKIAKDEDVTHIDSR
jgi:hypothetical protein